MYNKKLDEIVENLLVNWTKIIEKIVFMFVFWNIGHLKFIKNILKVILPQRHTRLLQITKKIVFFQLYFICSNYKFIYVCM